jgi:DNA repair exonuclease SbcCD ATPase subunit
MPVKIRIRDFQSLGDVSVTVDRLTVVTGSNNTGKSALIRACRGAFQNTRGTSFIRNGKPKSIVEMDFGDGHTLVWEKGRAKGDKPTYIVDGGDPIHPGQGVPDEVRALGVVPITAGGREIWPQIAPQFQQIFLFDQPGSVMAEAVADVERVSQLNEALRMAASDKRSATSELAVRRLDEATCAEDLKRFDGLDGIGNQIQAIEESAALAQRIDRALDALRDLRDRWVGARNAVARFSGIEQVVVPGVEDIQGQHENIIRIASLRDRRRQALSRVLRLTGVDDIQANLDTAGPERLLAAVQVVRGLRDRLLGATERISQLEHELEAAKDDEARATDELFGTLDRLGQCPVCGSLRHLESSHGNGTTGGSQEVT